MAQKSPSSFLKPHLPRIVATVSRGPAERLFYERLMFFLSWAELWIRMHWIRIRIRIRIQLFMWIRIRIRIQGFDDQKLKKKMQQKSFCLSFFRSIIAIYLSLGLYKGRPSYSRSLQSSKENIQHFKKNKIYQLFFLRLRVIFALLNPYPDWGTPLDPDPIRIHNTAPKIESK